MQVDNIGSQIVQIFFKEISMEGALDLLVIVWAAIMLVIFFAVVWINRK